MKKKLVFWLCLLAVIVAGVTFGSKWLGAEQQSRAREQLEQALRRAAVACYASQGSYPETLEQLLEHGVVYDEERFVVMYEPVASNLLPDITVIEQ